MTGRFYPVFLLIVLFIIALSSYNYIPDNTPNANNMHLDLKFKPPGFKAFFIDTTTSKNKPFQWFLGKELNGTYIAWNDFNVNLMKSKGYKMLTNNEIKHLKHFFVKRKVTFWLGTDSFGRDLLSRLVLGLRNSLLIGLMAVLVSVIIGTFLGINSGYFGGKIDALIMWLINVLWSLPTLFIVFGISLILGKGYWQVFVAIALTTWVEAARVVRAEVISVRHKEFVLASNVVGGKDFFIILKHILPNITKIIWVLTANNFAITLLIESGLSFLGLGVQPPACSLGSLIRENYGYIVTSHMYIAFMPGLLIMLLVLTFNLIGYRINLKTS